MLKDDRRCSGIGERKGMTTLGLGVFEVGGRVYSVAFFKKRRNNKGDIRGGK